MAIKNEPGRDPAMVERTQKLNVVFALTSIGLLVVFSLMVWADYDREWKKYQKKFTGLEVQLTEKQIQDALGKVDAARRAELEQKLAEFVRVARDNDTLADKIHRFTRRLLRTSTRSQALAQIEAGLREDFDAYHTVLVLQVTKGGSGTIAADPASRFLREVASDNPILKSFESLFSNARPRCGQVRDSQREFLFGAEASAIGSVALIPLTAMSPPGLLVLGSVDRDRFHPGMSVEFLSRMAELIADSLLHP